jgi:hypothetical protein
MALRSTRSSTRSKSSIIPISSRSCTIVSARRRVPASAATSASAKRGAAHAAFPGIELCDDGGGDPVGRKLRIEAGKTRRKAFQRAAPGGEVPLEPVAVDVDDAGQEHGCSHGPT